MEVKTQSCPFCRSSHTGINKLPNGKLILHCDSSCGAIWGTETNNKKELQEEAKT